MKKQFFTFCIIAVSALTFSNKTFSQTRDAGGSGDGTSTPPQPCPTAFARNNGDGTCGGAAQIRLFFNVAPAFAPTLENIFYDGVSLLTNATPISGDIADLASKGYISYCLPTSNIPPAVKLTVIFKYPNSTQEECVLHGSN